MSYYRKTVDRSPDALRPTEEQVIRGLNRRELELLALQTLKARVRAKEGMKRLRLQRA